MGLPAGIIVEKLDQNTLAILIRRKCRIVMADGFKILEKADMLKTARPEMQVVLKTSAPVCSKTLLLFKNRGFKVINK